MSQPDLLASEITLPRCADRRILIHTNDIATKSSGRLAANDLKVTLADTDRSDEIGEMARAVAFFRDGMERAEQQARERKEAEAAMAARRAAREKLVKELVGRMEAIVAELAGNADVASEVKALANQTASETEDIWRRVEGGQAGDLRRNVSVFVEQLSAA